MGMMTDDLVSLNTNHQSFKYCFENSCYMKIMIRTEACGKIEKMLMNCLRRQADNYDNNIKM